MKTIWKFLVVIFLLTGWQVYAGPVNINSADKKTLMTVKGVGEKRAEAIISYRDKYGPFKSVDELIEVEGIGQSTLDSNRESLTVTDSDPD